MRKSVDPKLTAHQKQIVPGKGEVSPKDARLKARLIGQRIAWRLESLGAFNHDKK